PPAPLPLPDASDAGPGDVLPDRAPVDFSVSCVSAIPARSFPLPLPGFSHTGPAVVLLSRTPVCLPVSFVSEAPVSLLGVLLCSIISVFTYLASPNPPLVGMAGFRSSGSSLTSTCVAMALEPSSAEPFELGGGGEGDRGRRPLFMSTCSVTICLVCCGCLVGSGAGDVTGSGCWVGVGELPSTR
ncbi:hypothetical protein TGPRC2_425280, partial [Toxoplasma gondii TgCatPRC2]